MRSSPAEDPRLGKPPKFQEREGPMSAASEDEAVDHLLRIRGNTGDRALSLLKP